MSYVFNMVGGGSGGGGPSSSDAILTVTVPTGSTVTMTKGGVTLTPTMWVQAADNTLDCALFVIAPSLFDAQNAWTVTATNSGNAAITTIVIDTNKAYEVTLLPVIPVEYQLVEYLQSSGTQYIDTGVPARVQLKAEIITQENSGVNTDQTFLAGNTNTPSNTNAMYLGMNFAGDNAIYFGFDGFASSGFLANRDKCTIIVDFKSGQQTITVDGTSRSVGTATFSATTSSTTLNLLRRGNGVGYACAKVFSLKIYDYLSNGDLIRDMYPCYRKSDSVTGMYDTVNNVFYTNAGTGAFVVGPDV